jgi:glyoxylate/hydroxypyruvate reductase
VTVALLLEPSLRTTQMWLDALRAQCPDEHISLIDDIPDATSIDVAIVRGADPGDLRRFPNLGLIQCLWAGVDKLMADPTIPVGIPLARTVDPAMADQMAATALAHVLDVALHHHRYRANQSELVWQPKHAKPMHTKTVAILGFGTLGRRCAEYLAFVGAQVIGLRSTRTTADDHLPWTTTTDLNEAVASADIVINLLPLTTDTAGVLDANLFGACQRGLALINLGRGQHLVESDLLDALASGQLSRAILDVFAIEPLPTTHQFWRHPNITVTPHVAAETDPHTAAAVIASNLRSFRAGRFDEMTGLVDRAKGY